MSIRKLGSSFNKTKDQKNGGKFIPPSNTLTEEVNTSRRIYIEDYNLLKEMSYVSDKKITQILDEMAVHYQKSNFGITKLNKATKHTSKATTNKAIKVPVKFNEYLLTKATELNTNAKQLLSAMIQDYYNSNMNK